MNIKIGAGPINWSNDDFLDLGQDITLDQCLKDMQDIGLQGTEWGHKFPSIISQAKKILNQYQLQLSAAWHSTYLLDKSWKEEKKDFLKRLLFLKSFNTPIINVCECTHRIYPSKGKSLFTQRPQLTEHQWKDMCSKLEELCFLAEDMGIKVAYHPHMGTIIQNFEEIQKLMGMTHYLKLVFDTGHLKFAGIDPLNFYRQFHHKIAHIHFKDIREQILKQAQENQWDFYQSVKAGVFTVPGNGCIDFQPILKLMNQKKYQGWCIIEAEQNPEKANPKQYTQMGFQYLSKAISAISKNQENIKEQTI